MKKKPRKVWCFNPRGPIPEVIKEQLKERLLNHIKKKWSDSVAKLLLRFHGRYTYVAVVENQGNHKVNPRVCRYIEKGEIPLEICRLGYLWGIDKWEYAFFTYSDERYVPSVVASGSFEATPEQAFDCSANVHLKKFR